MWGVATDDKFRCRRGVQMAHDPHGLSSHAKNLRWEGPLMSRRYQALSLLVLLAGAAPASGQAICARSGCSESPSEFTHVDAIRAGITPAPAPDVIPSARDTGVAPPHARTHHVVHAAVGAGIGAAVGFLGGAAVGNHIDHTRPGTIPAAALLAVEGAGAGLVIGLVAGALWR